jgi:hypothetical protein
MATVIVGLEATAPGGRNAALQPRSMDTGSVGCSGRARLGEVEDALYAAAIRIGLVSDDGPRQTWATIRSGLGVGLRVQADVDSLNRFLD